MYNLPGAYTSSAILESSVCPEDETMLRKTFFLIVGILLGSEIRCPLVGTASASWSSILRKCLKKRIYPQLINILAKFGNVYYEMEQQIYQALCYWFNTVAENQIKYYVKVSAPHRLLLSQLEIWG